MKRKMNTKPEFKVGDRVIVRVGESIIKGVVTMVDKNIIWYERKYTNAPDLFEVGGIGNIHKMFAEIDPNIQYEQKELF